MNSNWKYCRLGDICTVERGGSPRPIDKFITDAEDGINWIKIGDTTDSMFITKTAQRIIPEGMKKSRYVRPGDFLLSNSMSFGRPYILKIDGCIHDGWLVLRDEHHLFDKRFLYYFLSAPSTYQKFKNMAVGGVVNNLNSQMVRSLSVPVPKLQDQNRIADIMDRVSNLSVQLKQQLYNVNQLVKSQFIEMFGDPATSNKYQRVSIGKLTTVTSGGTPSRKIERYWKDGGIPWVKTTELQNTTISDTEEHITEDGMAESSAKFVPTETILIAMYGQGKTRGMTALLENPATTNQACACILPSKNIEQKYLWKFMILSYENLRSLAEGAGQPNLNAKMIKDFQVIVPPHDLQIQYIQFSEQADKSKFEIQQSIDKLETLKKSLMQEYFG